MKSILLFSVLSISLFFIYSFSPNERLADTATCKVLLESINKEYEGECKKGLANGEGTANGEEDYYQGAFKKGLPYGKGKYIWGNGEFYIGEFKDGMRDGEGVMYTLNKETEAIEKNKMSLWKDDQFVKEIMEEKYQIIQRRNVVGVDVKKKAEERDRVEVNIKNSVELLDLIVIHDVGTLNKFRDDRFSIDFVEFPLSLKINYTTNNKFNATRVSCVIEVKIESPGEWAIDITN